ncbi:hypothetical protein imdm_1788 [gamma proteobacterium IMCC2047]|nr:hypothetical protein imdm_1788 [gamma proteobacterium IMCC2047]
MINLKSCKKPFAIALLSCLLNPAPLSAEEKASDKGPLPLKELRTFTEIL